MRNLLRFVSAGIGVGLSVLVSEWLGTPLGATISAAVPYILCFWIFGDMVADEVLRKTHERRRT